MAPRKKKTQKVLKSVLDNSGSVAIPPDAAAIVLHPDGKASVYISEVNEKNAENSEAVVYKPHEELCIALAALLQNQSFVQQTIKTFRDLFDEAIKMNTRPKDSID